MENPEDALAPSRLLGLLDRLKAALESFAAREAAMEGEHHLHAHRVRERRDEALGMWQERMEHDAAAGEEALESELASAGDRARRRSQRVERALRAAIQQLSRSLTEKQGHRVYRLQMAMMQRQRDLAAERERRIMDHQAALATLQAEGEALRRLRRAAARALRGYRKWTALLLAPPAADSVREGRPAEACREEASAALAAASEVLRRFRRLALPRFFAALPLSLGFLLLSLGAGAAAFGLPAATGEPGPAWSASALVLAGGLGILGLAHFMGSRAGGALARELIDGIRRARAAHEAAEKTVESEHAAAMARLEAEEAEGARRFHEERKRSPGDAVGSREAMQREMEARAARLRERVQARLAERTAALRTAREGEAARLRVQAGAAMAEAQDSCADALARLESGEESERVALEREWHATAVPLREALAETARRAEALFPAWDRGFLASWRPPREFALSARVGTLEVDLGRLAEARPRDPRLALPGEDAFALPVALAMPGEGSVLLESAGPGREEIIAALNQAVLRLLSVAPPGKLSFTLIDPVGLGESFSGLMHLADYDESLIQSRAWTQTAQIESRLADLNSHIEKVIQMYLRDEFASITEYNRQAGRIAEKYRFVVVADFPAGFSEQAARGLMSVAASGPRCGVHLLLHWDTRKSAPQEFLPDELRRHCLRVVAGQDGAPLLAGRDIPGTAFILDRLPGGGLAGEIVHKLGAASRDAEKVEVPFAEIAPSEGEMWTSRSASELRVPVGRTGATKRQHMAIGKDTRQHVLVAGKTGSGKSTLFHVMITNLALWFSPDEVEFYLVDFKKGVEFKRYATSRLPHARVIAIESDREFGLSVLQRLDEELKRRGDLFRRLGVQDLPGYAKSGAGEPLPRVLLLIDEFQEFFVEDDRVAQNANVLLDRIVRQGRAFGIHVILGSQTLGGAYTLARATLGQMAIRVALQCNEADAYLIMDDSNPAPRLLTRPGEGIYNDQAGRVEGNSPFQVVWLSDEEREEWLARISRRAAASGRDYPAPVVFEGNAPAEIRENVPLRQALAAFPPGHRPAEIHWWLGAPNAIKGPTQAVFRRQSGNHLLVMGQRDEAALAILCLGMIALAAQHPPGGLSLYLFDSSAPETLERAELERAVAALPGQVRLARGHDTEAAMAELAAELERRAADENASAAAPSLFVLIHGLQRHKKLRHEEDFSFSLDDSAAASAGARLNDLITEGPAQGIHVAATCDTWNNLNRSLSRKALSEFEMRVLFQMSASDSASLIDSPKASALGLHRALFCNEQEGYLETFRPYAMPDGEWLEEAGSALAAKA